MGTCPQREPRRRYLSLRVSGCALLAWPANQRRTAEFKRSATSGTSLEAVINGGARNRQAVQSWSTLRNRRRWPAGVGTFTKLPAVWTAATTRVPHFPDMYSVQLYTLSGYTFAESSRDNVCTQLRGQCTLLLRRSSRSSPLSLLHPSMASVVALLDPKGRVRAHAFSRWRPLTSRAPTDAH